MSLNNTLQLIYEVNDYQNNEDYKNSKKVGTIIGGINGAIGGGVLGAIGSNIAHPESAMHHQDPGTLLAHGLGGAAIGGVLGAIRGRMTGHFAGKEIAKDPNNIYSSSMKGFVKDNLLVNTPAAAASGLLVGGPAGLALNAGNQLIGGTVASVPAGALHGYIVKKMRKQ